jgi:hypothetical protein
MSCASSGARRGLDSLGHSDGSSTTRTGCVYNSADQLTRETVGQANRTHLYKGNGSRRGRMPWKGKK